MASVELSRELVQARARSGASLRDVAAAAGTAPSYLHRLERQQASNPSPAVLRRLAAALDVPYTVLMRAAGHL